MRTLQWEDRNSTEVGVSHSHVAVRAAVSKRAPLLLEGDEIPYGHHGVVRHIEVEQFHTGEGVESTQFTRRAGEVFSHKKAICREGNRRNVFLSTKWRTSIYRCKQLFVLAAQNVVGLVLWSLFCKQSAAGVDGSFRKIKIWPNNSIIWKARQSKWCSVQCRALYQSVENSFTATITLK